MVYGMVTDVNGAPIANATLTCEHHSYKPSSLCSGSLRTDATGGYVFTDVFFHDTDTSSLSCKLPAMKPKISRSFFTSMIGERM
jgi:hypothetical protein